MPPFWPCLCISSKFLGGAVGPGLGTSLVNHSPAAAVLVIAVPCGLLAVRQVSEFPFLLSSPRCTRSPAPAGLAVCLSAHVYFLEPNWKLCKQLLY